MRRVAWLFLLSMVLGCRVKTGAPRIVVVPDSADVVVGAKYDVAVQVCQPEFDLAKIIFNEAMVALAASEGRLDMLLAAPFGLLPGCNSVGFTVTGTEWKEGRALPLERKGNADHAYTVTADAESNSILRLGVRVNGEETDRYGVTTIHAKVPNRVEMTRDCFGTDKTILAVGRSFEVKYKVFADDALLHGYDYEAPVELENLEKVSSSWSKEKGRTWTFRALHPGAARITSPIDPTHPLELTALDSSAATSLHVTCDSDGPLYTGDSVWVWPDASSDPESTCAGLFMVDAINETPLVCSVIKPAEGSDATGFFIKAVSTGSCRVRIDVPKTTLTSSVTFEVVGTVSDLELGEEFVEPRALWGTGPSDLWAVGAELGLVPGDGGNARSKATQDKVIAIMHFDGASWTKQTQVEPGIKGQLKSVWGSGPTDVVAVGTNGLILQSNGTSWSSSQPATDDLCWIWGSGPDRVFAVGANGRVLRRDASGWTTMPTPRFGTTPLALYGVWGSGPNDVYAVGCTTDPRYQSPTGIVLHSDGETWTKVAPDSLGIMQPSCCTAVWGTGPSNVNVLCNENWLRYTGGWKWTNQPLSSILKAEYGTLWGGAPNDLFYVWRKMYGGDDYLVWLSEGSKDHRIPQTLNQHVEFVWGTSSRDVYWLSSSAPVIHHLVR